MLSRPAILAILNVTPDSFSDGGRFFTESSQPAVELPVRAAWQFVRDGADILDIGGESTRPGSDPVEPEEECERVLPVLEALRAQNYPLPISVDTRRLLVAQRAVELGATIINDTSALRDDPDLVEFVVAQKLRVILMHRQGQPKEMQKNPHYRDCLQEVGEFLEERALWACSRGVDPSQIVVDPGLGFGKRLEDNYRLMRGLDRLTKSSWPVLVGASRKSFLGRFDDRPAPERLPGSLAVAGASLLRGAAYLRVHDVRDTRVFLDTLLASMSHDPADETASTS